jgi:hypothetical protein
MAGFSNGGTEAGGSNSVSVTTVTVEPEEEIPNVVDVSYIENLLGTCDQVFCDSPVHNCTFAHDRLLAGPDNVYNIMAENKVWTDLGFIPNYFI